MTLVPKVDFTCYLNAEMLILELDQRMGAGQHAKKRYLYFIMPEEKGHLLKQPNII